MLVQLALGLDVSHAVGVQPLQPFLIVEPVDLARIFAFACPARLGHRQHQTMSSCVLAAAELQSVGELFKTTGNAKVEAIAKVQRWRSIGISRPAETRREQQSFDHHFNAARARPQSSWS